VAAAVWLDKVTAGPVMAITMAGRVPVLVVSILLLLLSWVVITRLFKALWAAEGRVAPVQVKVTVLTAIGLAERVIVKTSEAKAEEVGSVVPAGAVNLHTGVEGHKKPVNVVKILPDAGICWARVAVPVTVTPVADAAVLDKVTAVPVRPAAIMAGKVPAEDVSILLLLASLVTTAMLVNALWVAGRVAPEQVKVTVPATIAPVAESTTFRAPPLHWEEEGSGVEPGAVNLHTGVCGKAKPVK